MAPNCSRNDRQPDLARKWSMIHYIMVLQSQNPKFMYYSTGKYSGVFRRARTKSAAKRGQPRSGDAVLGQSGNNLVLGDDRRYPSARNCHFRCAGEIGANPAICIITESEQFDTTASVLRGDFLTSTIAKRLLLSILVTGVISLILFALLTRRIRHMNEVVQDFEQGNWNGGWKNLHPTKSGNLVSRSTEWPIPSKPPWRNHQKTDQLRRDLIANVSHDLRSRWRQSKVTSKRCKSKRRNLSGRTAEIIQYFIERDRLAEPAGGTIVRAVAAGRHAGAAGTGAVCAGRFGSGCDHEIQRDGGKGHPATRRCAGRFAASNGGYRADRTRAVQFDRQCHSLHTENGTVKLRS